MKQSILESTMNTRALPTGTMRYIRSDAPISLTDREIQWLLKNDITTIVDLRSEKEIEKKPCKLQRLVNFTYINLPVTGGGDVPKTREQLYTIYSQMFDKQMEKIIDTIMNAKSNVMYFCTAGKDRTGVVSALILKKLGFDDESIIDDYMISKENLIDILMEYVSQHPEVDIDIIIPHRENMIRFLEQLRK